MRCSSSWMIRSGERSGTGRWRICRAATSPPSPDDPDLDDQMYSVTYRGLKLVFVGERGAGAGDNIYARYIQKQLATDDHVWKICSWHRNQQAMQVGGK